MVDVAACFQQDDESDTSGHHVPKAQEDKIAGSVSKPDVTGQMVPGDSALKVGVSNYLSKNGESALAVQEPGDANDILSGHPFYYVKQRVNQEY
jgi:hypothetical protein